MSEPAKATESKVITEPKITPELIAKLRERATDKTLTEKVYLVCEEFGDRQPKRHGDDITFKEGPLTLYTDSFAYNCSASWNGEEVYTVHLSTVIAYRPSVPKWEDALNVLSEKARTKRNATEQRSRDQEQKELRKRWG